MKSEFEFIDRWYSHKMCYTRKCLVCQASLHESKQFFCEDCRPFLEEVAPILNTINPEDYPGLNLKLGTGLMVIAVEKVFTELELESTFWFSKNTFMEKLDHTPEYQTLCKIREPGSIKSALGQVLKAKGWQRGSGHRGSCSKTYYRQSSTEQRQELARMEEGAEA